MGETLEQRADLAGQLASLGPDEVPLNFLNPRPGTPLAGRPAAARPADVKIAIYFGIRPIARGDL
jgi:biotin synthase